MIRLLKGIFFSFLSLLGGFYLITTFSGSHIAAFGIFGGGAGSSVFPGSENPPPSQPSQPDSLTTGSDTTITPESRIPFFDSTQSALENRFSEEDHLDLCVLYRTNANIARTISRLEEPQTPRGLFTGSRSAVIEPPTTVPIFQWIDENGRVNFSDQAPPTDLQETTALELPGRLEYFNLTTEIPDSSSISPSINNQVTNQVTGIYEVISGLLGVQRLKVLDMRLSILPDRESYFQYAQEITGTRKNNIGGFYSPARKEAVTYMYPDFGRTVFVARHEAVHVMLSELLGNPPNWLNEGLALYFEKAVIGEQSIIVDPPEQMLEVFRNSTINGNPPNPFFYLSGSNRLWTNNPVDAHYAYSGSLIYFLLSSDRGINALTTVLHDLSDNYCENRNSTNVLMQSYGGSRNFENDFYSWLRDTRPKQAHVYSRISTDTPDSR